MSEKVRFVILLVLLGISIGLLLITNSSYSDILLD